jgi:hypothetical protein
MKTSEVSALLTMAAAFDNRTVGEANVAAWASVLHPDMRLSDGMEAMKAHFAKSSEYLKPAHINQGVDQIRRERLAKAPIMLIPTDLHQAVERQWMRAFTDAVKDGESDPHATADTAMGIRRRIEIETQRDMTTLRLTPRSA